MDWAADNGKCVRHKTVRQQNTQHKSGTLPLNMYLRPLPDQCDLPMDSYNEQVADRNVGVLNIRIHLVLT